MDEPLSNLDAQLRVEARSLLAKMHRELKTTTIYVTHDQAEAMTLGDSVVVMNEGVIQQHAPPLEVYNAPSQSFRGRVHRIARHELSRIPLRRWLPDGGNSEPPD